MIADNKRGRQRGAINDIEVAQFEFHDVNEAYEEARLENLLTEQMIVNSSKMHNSTSYEIDESSIP